MAKIYNEGGYQGKKKFPTPDLILLDINLPKLCGLEALERILKDRQYSSISIIMLTSSKQEDNIVKSYGNGAAGYIQKPVSLNISCIS